MTVPVLKIKVIPKPVIKGRMDVRFPANIHTEKFLKVARANGTYTFDIDYTLLSAGPVSSSANAYLAVLDVATGLYLNVSLASLLTSGLDADLQAIAALTGTGILVRTASDTWAQRSIVAGALMGVTDGDGVAGNPTITITDPELVALAGLTSAADKLPYFDGAGSAALADFTAYGRSIVAVANEAALKALVNLEIGTDVQAYSADLDAVSGTNTGDQTITLTGDVTGSGTGSFAATIGAGKVTSAMLNADVFSTAHSWSGTQTFTAPVLGTPASATLTNATGLPISTGLSGLGTGVATFLATPSSANLASAVTDETGSGALVFANSPALTGTPTAPTASPSDNSTKIATTAYVDAQVAGGVAGVASIDGQTGAFTTDDSLSSTSNILRAQFKGHLYGLTLSNNATDATNDIDIAAGEAADADGNLMVLPSGITKRLDGNWAPGNDGGLDTGSIANAVYHVWLIQRSDTGVVDALFSTSATSPTMPTNYDRKRRVGSIIRPGGAILAFRQQGDMFKLATSVADRNSTSAASSILLSLTVPSGIRVIPLLGIAQQQNAAGDVFQQIGDGDNALVTTLVARTSVANERETSFNTTTITNTSAQIRYSLTVNSGSVASASLTTFGWIDDRGRN